MFMYHYGYWGFHGMWGYPLFWGFGWIGAIITVIPFWKICMRVGLSPWLSLLLVVPLVNLIFVYYVAFSAWPALRAGSSPGGPGPQPPGTGTGPTAPGR